MEQITADAAEAAEVAAVLASLGPVAVVRMVPTVSHTVAGVRRRTHVTLWTADGIDLTAQVDEAGHGIARDAVRAAFPGRVWDAAVDYMVTGGCLVPVVALRVPPEPQPTVVLPLAVALAEDAEDDCPCERGEATAKCTPRGCAPAGDDQ